MPQTQKLITAEINKILARETNILKFFDLQFNFFIKFVIGKMHLEPNKNNWI